jgi:predicted dehydrogenase
VLEDEVVSACCVALRDDVAQEAAREVLRSGRHLFMEKPMATRMEDAILLKELAETKGLVLHVDHILVYNPVVRKIKEYIDSGEIGDVISFESTRSNLGPIIKHDMNAMWDLAVHDLAVIDFLCGSPVAVKVDCIGEKVFGEQEIITYLTVKFDGFIAMVKSSWFSPLKERSVTISGTKKMIVFNDLMESEKLMIYDKGVEFDQNTFKEYGSYEAKVRLGDLYIPYVEQEDALLNGLAQFAE